MGENSCRRNNPEEDTESPPSGSPLSPQQQDQHRQAVVTNADISAQEPSARRDDKRMYMMRSVVTEPLLSRVQSALKQGRSSDTFEVIISLNETFSGGAQAAQNYVKQRAEQWAVKYSTSSHYLFACLTAEQILQLAEEARALTRDHGPKGSVVYRIWEDNDIHVSLTRSLATVKADAAQRSFHARGDNVVLAVLDSGIQKNHPHFKSDQSPFGPIDTLCVELPVTKQNEFVENVLKLLDGGELDATEGLDQVRSKEGSELLDALSTRIRNPIAPNDDSEGGAAGVGDVFVPSEDGGTQSIGSFFGSVYGRIGQFLTSRYGMS